MILKYYKGQPNLHIIRYRAGEIAAEGAGLNFWYWPWNTTIATVPLATQEAPFIFNEFTANYQEVAIQGVLTYRLEQPLTIAAHLDYTIETGTGRYTTDDPDKLVQQVVDAVQAQTRYLINDMPLEEGINAGAAIGRGRLCRGRVDVGARGTGHPVGNAAFSRDQGDPGNAKSA